MEPFENVFGDTVRDQVGTCTCVTEIVFNCTETDCEPAANPGDPPVCSSCECNMTIGDVKKCDDCDQNDTFFTGVCEGSFTVCYQPRSCKCDCDCDDCQQIYPGS